MLVFVYKFLSIFISLPKEISPMDCWEKCYGKDLPFALKIRHKLYNHIKSPKICRFLNLFNYMVYPNNDMGRSIFVSGTYEPNTLMFLKNFLKIGDTFIDIGANSGIYSIVAAKLVGDAGKVYSFEPSSREFFKLQENVLLNNLQHHIVTNKLAISSKNEKALLKIATESHNGQNTLCNEFAYTNVDSGHIEEVNCISLDEYVNNNSIFNIKLIKIDVEGYELNVFEGANSLIINQRPLIIFEVVREAYRKNNLKLIDLKNYLLNHNYLTYSIDNSNAMLSINDIMKIPDGNILAVPTEKKLDINYK